jgi:hypothetical protein
MLKVQNSANGEDLMSQFEEGDVRPFDDRGKYERTTLMYVVNHVPTAAIKICFMQATCRYKLRAGDNVITIQATRIPSGVLDVATSPVGLPVEG